MDGFVAALVLLFICVSVWAFTTWRKLNNTERLKELVTWSVFESDGARGNMPLWAHLKNAQVYNVSDQYRINGDEEWATVKEVIERYQKELTQSYFDGRLWNPKSVYGIDGKDYFLYMLYVYLCENANYGQNTVFSLRSNEIGNRSIVFHKMRYITYMYCKGNLALQNNVPAWNESVLKAILDDDIAKKKKTAHKIPVPSDPGIKINYRGRP